MATALLIGLTGALGFVALDVGVIVLGKLPLSDCKGITYRNNLML
jgi:hypothetical protein